MPKFYLISWCGAIHRNSAENPHFHKFFTTKKSGEITFFYAVKDSTKKLQVTASVDLTCSNSL